MGGRSLPDNKTRLHLLLFAATVIILFDVIGRRQCMPSQDGRLPDAGLTAQLAAARVAAA